MPTLRLLAFAGSARRESLNQKALRVLSRHAREAGAEVTELDLAEFVLPLYNGDLEAEQGLPEAAARLQVLAGEHDGFLIASPEYNGFPTPLLKNTLDWLSRPVPGNLGSSGLVFLRGKPAGLVAASPGPLGGIRGLPLARQYLANLGLIVVPEQVALGNAHTLFDEAGELIDPRQQAAVQSVAAAVVRLGRALLG
ncbi:NADPH-dependent FMN reductase [Methylococcus sp. EFPC2]|uniref:NADPH-dependent FMN reductase n=1 Tax=Methylococcus sp. EFPC2 TaxID=2812648 RepID=UPI001967020B|nr:NAD(P)H-dependent oxidoreductase [Methylococcus sp. EFPC2]QSA98609.1 NAD(P)H-dependent oxidoreductase [Methylococcus sp. EFPC2]